MPVETPRTPDFADALEERLRADVGRAERGGRGLDVLVAVLVIAALGGGGALLLTTTQDGERARESASTTPRASPTPGVRSTTETGRSGRLSDPGRGRVLGTVQEFRRPTGADRDLRLVAHGLPAGEEVTVRVAGGEAIPGPPVGADGTLRRTVTVPRTPIDDAEILVESRRGGRRVEVLRGKLDSAPSRGPFLAGGARETGRADLLTPGGKPRGQVRILRQGGDRALQIDAVRVPAGSRYVVWVDGRFLGFAPPVKADGYLSGLAPLEDDAARGATLLVTRETGDRPKRPGTVVLRTALP